MVRILESNSARITAYFDAYSRRVRVDDYEGKVTDIIPVLDAALPPWTEKLIIKSRPDDAAAFESKGFRREAFVSGYFAGTDMYFLARYLAVERSASPRETDEAALIRSVLLLDRQTIPVSNAGVEFATHADAATLAKLYGDTFRIYPTPVNDPAHLAKTMDEGTVYVIMREGMEIVSAASAEINTKYKNAELTDCASALGHEGKGHMRVLLGALEDYLRSRGVTCLYTIARSSSFGMNKAFHQLGYTFGGLMTKNCMIYSGMEDMNVWWK